MREKHDKVAIFGGWFAAERHEQLVEDVIGNAVNWGIDQGKTRESDGELVHGGI
jgi:hypothetical protein